MVASRGRFRVSNARTQLEINQAYTVRELLLARLGSFFGLVALLLVGVGAYGVLDYSVLQRWREIGIRMALGAQRRALMAGIVAQGMRVAGIGAVVGAAAALASARLFAGLLYGIQHTDRTTLVSVTLLITSETLLSCRIPGQTGGRGRHESATGTRRGHEFPAVHRFLHAFLSSPAATAFLPQGPP